MTYDAQKILNIAGELGEVMKLISGESYRQGSISDLEANNQLFAEVRQHLLSIDNSDGTESFAATWKQSHEVCQTVYRDVLENFATAIALVEAGAGTYQLTNDANEGGV
ncbi:hypothetical protein ACTWPT_06140 [Nonomuraea sp. 3N208]|uniref:hypothetical protein n=1 Tax=Nonomuraea sp. 3N208 TaxID=3457421 RepID=UPI003FCDFC49